MKKQVKRYTRPAIKAATNAGDAAVSMFSDQTWRRVMSVMDMEIERVCDMSKQRLDKIQEAKRQAELAKEKAEAQERISKMARAGRNPEEWPQKKRPVRYANSGVVLEGDKLVEHVAFSLLAFFWILLVSVWLFEYILMAFTY